jgi:hypothetical protein
MMTTTCSCRFLTSTEAQDRYRDEAPWSTTTPCQLLFLSEGRDMGDHARDTVDPKIGTHFQRPRSKSEIPLRPEWLDYYISRSAIQPKNAFILQ